MPANLNIVDSQGAGVGQFPINDASLEYTKGKQAVHHVVTAYLAGIRAGTACTKTRGEVSGTTAKPYRQKGTGRARAGARTSPIWRGGGVIFGPVPRSYEKKVNRKVRALALKRAFSERVAENAVVVIDQLQLQDHKTKTVAAILKSLGGKDSVLLIVKDYDQNLIRASGNIQEVMLVKAASVNVYQLLRFHQVAFTKDALEEFLTRF